LAYATNTPTSGRMPRRRSKTHRPESVDPVEIYVFPVPPCAGFLDSLFFVHNASHMDEKHIKKSTLVPLAQVTSQLGYRDARNFRLSVAPRLELPIVAVGLRWFAWDDDVRRIVNAIAAPVRSSKTEEGHQ